MVKKKDRSCCPGDKGMSICKVEAVISVDRRGQMVLPKQVRDRFKIKSTDKFALVVAERDGELCCLALIKAEELDTAVKDKIGAIIIKTK